MNSINNFCWGIQFNRRSIKLLRWGNQIIVFTLVAVLMNIKHIVSGLINQNHQSDIMHINLSVQGKIVQMQIRKIFTAKVASGRQCSKSNMYLGKIKKAMMTRLILDFVVAAIIRQNTMKLRSSYCLARKVTKKRLLFNIRQKKGRMGD